MVIIIYYNTVEPVSSMATLGTEEGGRCRQV